ncbi:MAG: hypothetical protein GY768_18250, partial [Planctomycetaceae bacterium]|nr:hypothetical protein [Planctomycetaceae bacterium]
SPVLQRDFFTFNDQVESIDCLTSVDIQSSIGLSVMLPSKEISTYAISELRRFVYETGRTYGILQCDQEKSLVGIVKAVLRQVGGLTFRLSPVYSSASQGSVERFHQTLVAQCRVLKIGVQRTYGLQLTLKHPLAPWLMKHACWLLNRFHQHDDGLTSYQRRWGKTCQLPLCEFAEQVLFRIPQRGPRRKFEDVWFPGLWLGRDPDSSEIMIGTSTGVFKVRSIRRRLLENRFQRQLFEAFKAVPWDHRQDGRFYPQFVIPNALLGSSPPIQFPADVQGEDVTPAVQVADEQDLQPDPPVALQQAPSTSSDVREVPLQDDQPAPPLEFHSLPRPSSTISDQQMDVQSPQPTDRVPQLASPEKRRFEPTAASSSGFQPAPPGGQQQPAKQTRVGSPRVRGSAERPASEPPATRRRITSKQSVIGQVQHVHLSDDNVIPVEVNEDLSESSSALKDPILSDSVDDFDPQELSEAMKKEMQSIENFDVKEDVAISQVDDSIIRSAMTLRWVHVWKGFVRSRLVVQGFRQEITDLDDTYASTPIMPILRVLLTMALSKGWSIQLCDVSTAFLHADLQSEEDIYVWPPKEFYPQGDRLWRLKKAMYGLRSSPKDWQTHFAKIMSTLGFRRLQSDANVYVDTVRGVYILVYVDDLLVLGDVTVVQTVIGRLANEFLLKRIGALDKDGSMSTFLGRELRRMGDAIAVRMKDGYLDSEFEQYRLMNCRAATTLGSNNLKHLAGGDEALDVQEHRAYRRTVGKLQWNTPLRPDACF